MPNPVAWHELATLTAAQRNALLTRSEADLDMGVRDQGRVDHEGNVAGDRQSSS